MGEGERSTKRRIAILSVVSYGLADLGGGHGTPGDARELP